MNGPSCETGPEPSLRLGQYRKFLLNRLTANAQFSSFLQGELARDDEQTKHLFHKVMVHKWTADAATLFSALTERCGAAFVPVHFVTDRDLCHFYTDSLSFIQKVISFDFIFPHEHTMYNVDILFGDRCSDEMFGAHVTTEQLVSGVVSRRFTNTLELDLAAVCSDSELQEKHIHLHSLAQLALYKRLMLRMGRDTKILNLSNNQLTHVPQEIMNFFMRGDIVGVNLSDNNIEKLEDLPRMSSLLERLWLEGNPLCDNEEPTEYVKKVSTLFPRLQELDGVAVNRHGFVYPFFKNQLVSLEARGLVEKFLTLFFSHYDSSPRSSLAGFYADDALFSISTSLTEADLESAKHLRTLSRNLRAQSSETMRKKLYCGAQIHAVHKQLPETTHDPTTFTVDVLHYTRSEVLQRSELLLSVDGVFRERRQDASDSRQHIYQFRRTFLVRGHKNQHYISNELLHIDVASEHMIHHAFNNRTRKLNELCLVEPGEEQRRALITAFTHLTRLHKHEVERRLKVQEWDLRKALLVFADELRHDRVSAELFTDSTLEDITDDDID